MTDAFTHEKRKQLTTLQRAKLFSDRGGICGGRGYGGCGKRIQVGEKWIDEHEIALALGGTNDWENRGLRHERCADEKTKDDMTKIAKVKRVHARHIGAHVAKGRPLPGTKASGWKHKADGSWERRK